jgi:uncharacterized protein YqfA (UPF0365 family)
MIHTPRQILIVIAIVLAVLSSFLPVPLWTAVLILGIALLIP